MLQLRALNGTGLQAFAVGQVEAVNGIGGRDFDT
jgi:hypothetical protein